MKRRIRILLSLVIIFSILILSCADISAQAFFVNVEVSPNKAGAVAGYRIFVQNVSIKGPFDRVLITFPDDTKFKGDLPSIEEVTINNIHPINISYTYDNNELKLTLFLPVKFSNLDSLEIKFSNNFGIINPTMPRSCYSLVAELFLGQNRVLSIPSFIYSIDVSTVSDVKVLVDNPVRSLASKYEIVFSLGVNGLLKAYQDYIYIAFPTGFSLKSNFMKGSVIVNGVSAAAVYKSSKVPNALEIVPSISLFPRSIYSNGIVDIVLTNSFGIINPYKDGFYTLKVWTSSELDPVESAPFEIVDTKIKNLVLSVDNQYPFEISNFKISFSTSVVGKLLKGDKIYVELPNEYSFSDSNVESSVIVNGLNASFLIENKVIEIETPVDIPANGEVLVEIGENFGIVNPKKSGDFMIAVWTDHDGSKAYSVVTIKSSLVKNVKLEAQYSGANSINSFNVSFTTGPVYTLSKDIDKILVKFDEGFTLPDTIEQNLITVNGTIVNNITKDGNTLYITSPIDVAPGGAVNVEIPESVGIMNPETPGEYGVRVSTSKEPTEVESNKIVITLLPQVNFDINPAVPNGLNGFYKTNPEVKLFTVNGTKVFYKIDDGEFAEYTNPFKIPEGSHAVYAYAVDSGNNKGDIIKKEFLVDFTPPTIKFDNASSNPVFKGSPGILSGSVSEPCTLKINDSVLELKDKLNFTVELPNVYEGMPITVYMVDLAGNQNSLVLTAHIDNIPPVIKFLDDGIKYQSGLYSVETTDFYYTIRVQLNEKGKLFINSAEIISKDNNTFESMVNLVDGENRFDVKAIDVAGNEATQTLVVRKVNEKKIVLTVGSTLAVVGNEQIILEAAPVIEQGVTLVPLRFIAEAFDSEVNWNGALQIITIVNKTHNIQLQINSKLVFIDNQKGKDLDVAPKIINGRTFVPIRFISEAFGATVDWDNNTKTVTITYKL